MDGTPVTWFYFLVKQTREFLKDENIIKEFDKFNKERLHPLWHQEKKAENVPYVLSFVGLSNVGKSTLAEALLGFPVAPHKNGPATAIPVRYIYNPYWRIKVMTRQFIEEEKLFENCNDLGKALKDQVVNVDEAIVRSIAWVTVEGPMEALKDGLILADTPGFGDARIGDDDDKREKRLDDLEKYIKEHVHRVYFCVAASKMTIEDEEKKFYGRINHLCNHIIVNKWEFNGELHPQEYINRFQLIFPGAEFIFVNAKNAIKGNETADINIVEKSNIEYLKSVIDSYSTPEKRKKMVWRDLLRAWKNFHLYMEAVHRLTVIPWREDSLKRLLYACKNEEELQAIVEDIERIVK